MKKDEKKQNKGIKVLFLGNSGVGKSNIINRSIGEQFNAHEEPTDSQMFSIKTFLLENNFHILHLCQTVSQEEY